MTMRKTYSRVQSYPTPESEIFSPFSNQLQQFFVPKLENPNQFQRSRISADHLSKILDASMISQKLGMRLAMDAVSPATGSNSDWKFINCYLDTTVQLLDACNNIQLRLGSIRSCLNSILIGLRYLDGEHEPSRIVLRRAAASLDVSLFVDKHHCAKTEKIMPRMRTLGRKLSGQTLACQATCDGAISPELYKALTGSCAMAAHAIEVLSSATSLTINPSAQPPTIEPWTMLLNEISNKMNVLPKETAAMEELVDAHLAAQALLKLVSSWQKGDSSCLRPMTVKVVSGELRRRKDELEKALSLLEENINELYKQIVAFRISMLGLLSEAQNEDVLEMVKPSSYEESLMDANPKHYQRSVTWVKIKTKKTRRPYSLGRIRQHFGSLREKVVK